MTPKRKVTIIPGCIVCNTCEFHAPDIFIVKEKSLEATVLNPYPAEDRLPDLYEAIRKCPEKVIKYRLEEENDPGEKQPD